MGIACKLEKISLKGNKRDIKSVRVTCSICNKKTEAYGREQKSVIKALCMLKEKCDKSHNDNFYYVSWQSKSKKKENTKKNHSANNKITYPKDFITIEKSDLIPW